MDGARRPAFVNIKGATGNVVKENGKSRREGRRESKVDEFGKFNKLDKIE